MTRSLPPPPASNTVNQIPNIRTSLSVCLSLSCSHFLASLWSTQSKRAGGRFLLAESLRESISFQNLGAFAPLSSPILTLPNKGFPFLLVKNQNNKKGEIIILAILFILNKSTRMLQKHWRQNQALGPRDALGCRFVWMWQSPSTSYPEGINTPAPPSPQAPSPHSLM